MEEALLPLAMTSDPRPFNQQLPEPPDPRCVLEPQDNPELAPALVCALCCCFGIIYCCFGYRCFKAVMFLSGLLSGALVIFLLCHKERVLETQLSLESYLQSLRERQLGPGTQATAPHTVLDLDSDCGSTVPLTTPSGSAQT
uniref:Transmembrane protein 198 n=1 Tax=Suricata suricatta TaxID=37032 RepID=A0A673UJ09_SURSU